MAKEPGKTEKATPRRKRKAREEGQVPKSQDLPIATTMLSTFIVLIFYIPFAYRTTLNLMHATLINQTSLATSSIALSSLKTIISLLTPIFIVLILTGIFSNIIQFGFLFTTKTLKPKFETINPIKGISRILSTKTAFELIRNLAKLTISLIIAFLIIKKISSNTFILAVSPLSQQIQIFIRYMLITILVFGLLSVPIAIIDIIYRRWEYEENLKMTKEEVKEERKLYEGHPVVKSIIRKKQKEFAMRRMMAEVKKADVVITNPQHYAVALRYERKKMSAPLVVAKGVDHMAERIKKIANENKIPVVENPSLAVALYQSCKVGEYIPENFFVAVAKIFAAIYRRKLS